MFKAMLQYPEDLVKLKCNKCEKLLTFEDDKQPTPYPMDNTASAECCGILYIASTVGIRVTSQKADGGN